MTSPKTKIDRENTLKKWAKHYKEEHGHNPYLALTPTGAKALKDYLLEQNALNYHVDYGAHVAIFQLRNFFNDKMGIKIPDTESGTEMVLHFFGATSMDTHVYSGFRWIGLDPEMLDLLAASKGHRR